METNVVYNEDCLTGIKKIPDNSIDLVVIDPPYDISIRGDNKVKSRISKNIVKIEKELVKNNLVNSYNTEILNEIVRVMKDINIYIWCNAKQIPMYIKYFNLNLKCKLEILIWHKINPIPLYNHRYMLDKEYCLYFRKKGYCNPKNYEDAKSIYTSKANIDDKKIYGHPTIKPLELIRKIIRNSSKENDIVLDCFLGSGTTAVACILEKRRFIGFEINKDFYNLSLNRIRETLNKKRDNDEL